MFPALSVVYFFGLTFVCFVFVWPFITWPFLSVFNSRSLSVVVAKIKEIEAAIENSILLILCQFEGLGK